MAAASQALSFLCLLCTSVSGKFLRTGFVVASTFSVVRVDKNLNSVLWYSSDNKQKMIFEAMHTSTS
jgi:hypothetical protein